MMVCFRLKLGKEHLKKLRFVSMTSCEIFPDRDRFRPHRSCPLRRFEDPVWLFLYYPFSNGALFCACGVCVDDDGVCYACGACGDGDDAVSLYLRLSILLPRQLMSCSSTKMKQTEKN